MFSLEERAWQFAMDAHASIGQRRKYTGLPYITHPGGVVRKLREVPGVTEAMLAAGWTHDTVEDVHWVTSALLAEATSPEVAKIVAFVTKVSTSTDGNRAARKAIDRAHYARGTFESQTVKVADLIDNVESIPELDADFAAVYLEEASLLLDVLTLAEPGLVQLARTVLQQSLDRLAAISVTSAVAV